MAIGSAVRTISNLHAFLLRPFSQKYTVQSFSTYRRAISEIKAAHEPQRKARLYDWLYGHLPCLCAAAMPPQRRSANWQCRLPSNRSRKTGRVMNRSGLGNLAQNAE